MNFEKELDMLFRDAVDVHDTIWYSDTETLRDAIVRTHLECVGGTIRDSLKRIIEEDRNDRL